MLGSFSRSPLQAHTGDPNDHILVSPARGTTPYSPKSVHYVDTCDSNFKGAANGENGLDWPVTVAIWL